ncbi:dipeptidase E [Bacteroidales bacterium]|nr:dipeptidase E [Bacteroidales bacterium]
MNLLLLSNSSNPGEAYLEYPQKEIKAFLGNKPLTAIFIPYAAVTFSYDVYEAKVEDVFSKIGHKVRSIHHFDDPIAAIEGAEAIIIGGGNTWRLVQQLHLHKLMDVIRQKVSLGTPYIGWSAGSNVACPSLKTSNDMPIVDPISFETLNLIPFQINPHFLDIHPAGFGGETREDRIMEFIELNPDTFVVGLRESSLFHITDNTIELKGPKTARIFKKGLNIKELGCEDDFSFLLNK